jgi:hypothetical protein
MKGWLIALLTRLLGAAGQLFGQVMTDLRDRGAFNRAVDLAQVTVSRLAGDTSIDNETKRRLAIEGLRTALQMEGKLVRDSLLGLAVELAVTAAKAAVTGGL